MKHLLLIYSVVLEEVMRVRSEAAKNVTTQLTGNSSSVDVAEIFRRRDHIFNWDFWCQLQKAPGDCHDSIIRYYYDVHLDECEKFIYTGCNGNKNMFTNYDLCNRYCKGSAFLTIKQDYVKTRHYCHLQPNAGLCMALETRFYFDINEKTCKSFVYGGCSGNSNNFESIARCIGACRDSIHLTFGEQKEDV